MSTLTPKATMPGPRLPQSRFRKRTILGVMALFVVLTGASGYWYLTTWTARMLRDAIAEADRLDPGWRLEEMEAKRAKIPDGENSALEIEEASRHIPASWPLRTGQNQANSVLRFADVPVDVRLGDPLATELRAELAKLPQGLIEARNLADMPRGRHAIAYAPGVISTLLPHIDACRNIARVLQADAALRANDGDIDGALDDCRAILNVGRSIGDEPFLISQLVRVVLQGMSLKSAQRALAQGEASEAALAKYQGALVEESRFPIALVMLRGERASVDSLLEKLSAGVEDASTRNTGIGGGWAARLPMSLAYFEYNRALILRLMNRAVEIAKRPDPEQVDAWPAWERDFEPYGSMLERWLMALATPLGPAIANAARTPQRGRAMIAATIAAIACERQRLAQGRFPESIDAIDPRFAKDLLPDPYTGRPVRIKADGDRLVVYTTGLDRKDDGGKPHPRGADLAGFDIVCTLWTPEGRRKASSEELPRNVFQTIPGDDTEPTP